MTFVRSSGLYLTINKARPAIEKLDQCGLTKSVAWQHNGTELATQNSQVHAPTRPTVTQRDIGKLFTHTCTLPPFTKQYKVVSAKSCEAGKVTAGLAWQQG